MFARRAPCRPIPSGTGILPSANSTPRKAESLPSVHGARCEDYYVPSPATPSALSVHSFGQERKSTPLSSIQRACFDSPPPRQPNYLQSVTHSWTQANSVTPAFSVTSLLSLRSFSQERKSTPLLSIACARFCRYVGELATGILLPNSLLPDTGATPRATTRAKNGARLLEPKSAFERRSQASGAFAVSKSPSAAFSGAILQSCRVATAFRTAGSRVASPHPADPSAGSCNIKALRSSLLATRAPRSSILDRDSRDLADRIETPCLCPA
jgi:hypothetical protein